MNRTLWNFTNSCLDQDSMPYMKHKKFSKPYQGEAYMIDEFGGIRWVTKMQAQEVAPEKLFWGYGKDPQSLDEYYKRLKEQVNVILSMDYITDFCYTQLVDVELEKNGIYTYDRKPKFDMDRIREIFSKSRSKAKAEVQHMVDQRNNQ